MKRTIRNSGAWLAALLLTGITIAGCDGGSTPAAKGGAAMAITTEDKFKAPPGADPSVTAELGGNGFEKIAADSGWKTNTMTPDQFSLISDTNAVKGGQITFHMTEFPATFRAMGKDENTEATRFIYGMVYENLIGVNPLNYEFLPGLASHWKVGADGQTYWFRIDPRARFSDGHPVTTEDVIATYKLGLDPGILSPYTNSFYAGFDTPVVVSKYVFHVRSKEKNWKNMLYFGGMTVLPAHVIGGVKGEEYLKKYQYDMPPGTGNYVVLPEDVKKGQSITLTRRTNYWGKDDPLSRGSNNFDKLKILIIQDENLAYEKFRAGELDFMVVSRAQWWHTKFNFDEIKNGWIQKRKVFTDDPVGFGGLAFNTRKEPFSDERIREAITLLFNRKQIVEKVLYNEYLINYSYYPNSPYENPNNPHLDYNPERAGQLLDEAGYTQRNAEGLRMKNGKPFVIDFPTLQQLSHVITPIEEDFRKAGVKLNIRYVDGVTQFKLMNDRNFDMIYTSWGGLLFPNPISSFKSDLADKPNTNNVTGIKNPRIDAICEEEQVTFDPAKRIRLLQELDSILVASKHYALNWYAPFSRYVYWNKFGHPQWYIGKLGDYKSIIGSWWYDAEKATKLAEAKKSGGKLEVGPLEVKFWPEYNKQHPMVMVSDFSAEKKPEGAATDTASNSTKPSMK